MPQLIQLTYTSVSQHPMERSELLKLLAKAREQNQAIGVTGMLLYTENTFFQVLEGEAETVDSLFSTIKHDPRHTQITLIIREPIAQRDFGEWTMGYTELSADEIDEILGANDFFTEGNSREQLPYGRAKKLLDAFRQGRWRSRVSNASLQPVAVVPPRPEAPSSSHQAPVRCRYSFAFQPIIDTRDNTLFSYEALIRGPNREPASWVLDKIPSQLVYQFDEESRRLALELAAHLGLSTRLNLNLLPRGIENSPSIIRRLLETIQQLDLAPEKVVIEILEKEIISDLVAFNELMDQCRAAGVIFAIDDFGSGYAGLNMLAEFQPNLIKLDMELVRGIDHRGPRQAIVRGIQRTCEDLGIDIIAEGVESEGELRWLKGEGIHLFQGNLLAKPAFEELSSEFNTVQL